MKLLKKSVILGAFLIGEFLLLKKQRDKEIERFEKEHKKVTTNYEIMVSFLMAKNSSISIAERLVSNGYKNIAIYGMGEIGKLLYKELKNSNVKIKYGIDLEQAGSKYEDLQIVSIKDNLEIVDVIIITPVFAYDKIEKSLNSVCNYEILSLDDILF